MLHLRTAWNNIRRSPYQAMAAVFVLTLTFFVITILSILVYSSQQIITYFETRPQIIAFLKDDAPEGEMAQLQQKLVSDSRIKSVKFVTKEEAYEIYKVRTSKNPKLSELLNTKTFPASLELNMHDLQYAQDIINELKENQLVEEVGFTASLEDEDAIVDVVGKLRSVTKYIRIGGATLALFLVGTSFLVLIVIIGMRMTTRRGEVEILKLIGATRGFIRGPLLYESLMYAFLGTISGWVIAILLVLYASPSLFVYFKDIAILPKETLQLFSIFGTILGAELLIAFVLAASGSMIAVSRTRKR